MLMENYGHSQSVVTHNHFYNFKYDNLILNYYIDYIKLYKDSIFMVPKSDIDSKIILFDNKNTVDLNLKYNNTYHYRKGDYNHPEYARTFIYFNLYGCCNHIIKNILIEKTYKKIIEKEFETNVYINKIKIKNEDFIKDIMELFKSIYEDLNNETYDNRVYNFVFLDKI